VPQPRVPAWSNSTPHGAGPSNANDQLVNWNTDQIDNVRSLERCLHDSNMAIQQAFVVNRLAEMYLTLTKALF